MTDTLYGEPTEWDEIPTEFRSALRTALSNLGWNVAEAHETAVVIDVPGLPEDHTWYLGMPNYHGKWCYGIANDRGYCANPQWLYVDPADPDALAEAAAAVLRARADAERWPAPERAYAKAPSIIREIGWTAQAAADKPFGTSMGREFWLRKAALLDRIALADEAGGHGGDATEAAELAAARLIDLDSPNTICDPRHYVRQQYARWTKHQ